MACYVGMKAATTFCTRRMSGRVARHGSISLRPGHLRSASTHSLCSRQPPSRAVHNRSAGVMVRAEGNGSGEYDYDLFVIGGGSGGVRMARMSAGHGAKVALCELPFAFVSSDTAGGLGGTCVLRGCVPKKLMLYASDFAAEINDSAGFGWDVTINSLSWDMFMRKKRAELERLNGVYGRLLSNANVEAIQGRGTVTGPHSVEVDGTTYTAKHIVVAVGGTPEKLPIPGGEHAITSDEVLELDAMPKKLLVLGAGYIGVEFAGIFHRFGTEVTIALRGDLLLRGFDNEVREFVTEEYRKGGMEVCTGTTPKEIVKNDDGSVSVTLVGPDGQERVETYDHCLMATGRTPKTKGLGLEEVGVKMSKKGGIVVNELSQSSVPSIYALGDVTERMELTPVALMEGMALSRHLFLDDPDAKPDHANIATAVFSYPPIGTVGLTEEEAVEQFGNVDVYTSSFRPMKNTISGSEQRALCKILVNPETDKVLGMHMVDPAAPEIMQGMGVAMKMGVTKKQLDSTVGIHPTSAEELVTMRSVSRKIRNREPVAV